YSAARFVFPSPPSQADNCQWRLTLPSSATRPDQRQFDATILCPTLSGVIWSDRARIAKAWRGDQIGLHALRDQILLHSISTLLRQLLVRGDPLPSQRWADRG